LAKAGYRWSDDLPEEAAACHDLEANQPDIYWRAIRRTFAELYSVPTDSVRVVQDARSTIVLCAGKTFTRHADSHDCAFVSEDEDPVTITLSAE
jgi:hypothetical protein